MIHCLKIEENYLKNLLSQKKKCEIRFNDRDYQFGDILEFADPLGELHRFTVTHIHSGLGLKEGYVVLSVERAIEQQALNGQKDPK